MIGLNDVNQNQNDRQNFNKLYDRLISYYTRNFRGERRNPIHIISLQFVLQMLYLFW